MRKALLVACLVLLVSVNAVRAQNTTANGATKFQTIHGLGVNANPQSWNVNPESVKKVLDDLITGMGCTSFRLMFDDCDWEEANDNSDPNSYNWTYYDSVYSAPRFTCVWNTIRYLNSRGITDITLSPDGAAPGWMGGTTLSLGKEEEYAEMMASMVYYGKKRLNPPVQFSLLSPVNETTCGGGEGAVMTPNQFGAMFSAIATHLINDGISDVTLVGPDDCDGWAANFRAMITNSNVMSKVRHFGQHEYGNSYRKGQEMVDAVKNSTYPDREVVMTEVNAVCKGCDDAKYNADYGFNSYAGPAYKYILQHLNAGVTGIQVWEAYDSQYHHPNRSLTWSMWGIFGVDDINHPDVYSKRAHFYVLKQLFNFVKPGFQRINISTNLTNMTISAFQDTASGSIVITGMNDSSSAQTMDCILRNLPAVSTLKYFSTDASHNFRQDSDITVAKQTFSKSIPAKCVFTFVGNRGTPAPASTSKGK
jgi:O-glycosyl hydrolase